MTGLTAQPPGSRRLRILLVDDEEVDRLAVRRSLGQSGLAATVDEAATSVETLARIGSADFDCLLLDYYLPGVDSLALLRRIRAIAPNLPVVIFTGRGDEEIAVELMKAGAVDYLPKASLTPERLASSLRHALELAEAAVARRRAEEELREQEARFRTLANSIPQLAWMMTPSGERFWFNQRWRDYTGTTLEELRGWGWQRLHHPEHLERVVAGLKRCLATGEPWEDTFPLRGRDGAYRWFLSRAVPVRDDEGGIVGWLGTNTDVTEQRATEQAIRESEERFRRALQIETVGVLFFTTDGRITFANDAFLRMAGYTRDDADAGRLRWDEMTPQEWLPHSYQAVEQYLATGRTVPYEKEYVRKDGTRWWALFAASRLNEHEGVGFVLDITDQKRVEQERALLTTRAHAARAEAEAALRARDAFFASVTHDLRNPLSTVKGYAQLLKRRVARGDGPPEQWLLDGLDQIEIGAIKTAALLEELLDLARYQHTARLELERGPCDLVALCQTVVAEQQRGHDRHRLQFASSVPELVGDWDRTRLERVIVNLVGNAIKYSPDGGSVLIRLDRGDGSAGPEAVLSVQDQGLGIPAEDLSRIFDRFQRAGNVQRRIGGTGIGLTSVRQIVEAHGGTVTVESQENVGSTFTIRVPLRPPRSA